MALDEDVELPIVFGGGDEFKGGHSVAQAFGEIFGGKEVGDFGVVIVVDGKERRGDKIQGCEVADEAVEEFGDAKMTELLEDAGLVEHFDFSFHMCLVFGSRLQKGVGHLRGYPKL